MARWSLTDNQAEAILNMRLRALRKLEEFEIRKEYDALSRREGADRGAARLATRSSGRRSAGRSSETPQEVRTRRPSSASAAPDFADAPEHDVADIHHAMIEKEPITVVVSEKGWLRAMKGHLTDLSLLTFKEGDSLKLAFHGADDRQGARLHHRRQVLHDRRRPAAGRPRPWRADPHHRRHGERPGHRHRLRARPQAQAAARLAMPATASSCRRPRSSPTPARASR